MNLQKNKCFFATDGVEYHGRECEGIPAILRETFLASDRALIGFEWGGEWTDRKDYQHFELPSDITDKYSEMYKNK